MVSVRNHAEREDKAGVAVVSSVQDLPFLHQNFDQVEHWEVAVEQCFPAELVRGVVILVDATDQVADKLLACSRAARNSSSVSTQLIEQGYAGGYLMSGA